MDVGLNVFFVPSLELELLAQIHDGVVHSVTWLALLVTTNQQNNEHNRQTTDTVSSENIPANTNNNMVDNNPFADEELWELDSDGYVPFELDISSLSITECDQSFMLDNSPSVLSDDNSAEMDNNDNSAEADFFRATCRRKELNDFSNDMVVVNPCKVFVTNINYRVSIFKNQKRFKIKCGGFFAI